MKVKYENIFWHQGIKIFEEVFLKKEKGHVRISHLENDVTKSLLNIFQLTDNIVLQKFLSLINIKDAAETFEYEFQVSDSKKYRVMPNRIMLSIVSSSTPIRSDSNYSHNFSIPDAAIYNNHTAILIECKTQSPLIREQISSHIKRYLGSATDEKIITWEEIDLIFDELLKKEKISNSFLLEHFIKFLELIGISEFHGFKEDDFTMLNLIGSIPRDDYLDYRRIFSKKIAKFMDSLNEEINTFLNGYNYSWKCAKTNPDSENDWSAFYFNNSSSEIHVNHFPNINFNYRHHGIELALNSEIKPAVEFLLKKLKSNEESFNKSFAKIDDFYFSLFYKIQYRPMDNFYWDLLYGYPKKLSEININELEDDIIMAQKSWEKIRNTFLYKIINGDIQKSDGNFYTEKEIEFVKTRNPSPNYVIRINKNYSSSEITTNKKSQLMFFANEIKKLEEIIALIFSNTDVEV